MSVFQHQLVDMHVITSHIYFIVHLQISSKKNQRMGAVLEMYNGDKYMYTCFHGAFRTMAKSQRDQKL